MLGTWKLIATSYVPYFNLSFKTELLHFPTLFNYLLIINFILNEWTSKNDENSSNFSSVKAGDKNKML